MQWDELKGPAGDAALVEYQSDGRETQRTFAAAAADDDAHAVSDTPESKPRFTPSTATRRALFGTPSSDHRPISRYRRSPR